ncbi:hypothetical protein QYM36_005687 [Artemia franciscana]|uniref:Uncharacterized protein n=1 Tax=Artemia franciscana TaxID=6661 RepID=A0AA88HUT6_ARTSF|nr:hypothetical protein QYM36_005687 [Artemia franciscana]
MCPAMYKVEKLYTTECIQLDIAVLLSAVEQFCEIRTAVKGFTPLTEKQWCNLTEAIVEKLKELELHIDYLHGQGYDIGSNIEGKYFKVQKRVNEINSRAFYVPYSSNSLNLVVNDVAHCWLEATKFFALVQKFVFIFLLQYNVGILDKNM